MRALDVVGLDSAAADTPCGVSSESRAIGESFVPACGSALTVFEGLA